MAVTRAEIKQALNDMPVMELVDLIAELEQSWGVSAAAPVAVAAAPAADDGAAAAEEQTEFDVVLNAFGDNKVSVIKIVRAKTGLGLKEAKEMVDSVPATIKEAAGKDDAEELKKLLEEAGATVELK